MGSRLTSEFNIRGRARPGDHGDLPLRLFDRSISKRRASTGPAEPAVRRRGRAVLRPTS